MSQTEQLVEVPVGEIALEGNLAVPHEAHGIVLFAHGSGSSRHSPRNNAVAERLHEAGLATLLFDLLTDEEDLLRSNRFEISMLTSRLASVTEWIDDHSEVGDLPVGYFGASTGAAAALRAAVQAESHVEAVVSRGGRVDMASEVADQLDVPCLFIVGSEDTDVLELNEETLELMDCERHIEIVEGAGHLFEGPGQLETVADLAAEWFDTHLE